MIENRREFLKNSASVIAGASKPEQSISNAASARWKMSTENLAEISDIASSGQ